MTNECVYGGAGAGVIAAHFGLGIGGAAAVALVVCALLSLVVQLAVLHAAGRQR